MLTLNCRMLCFIALFALSNLSFAENEKAPLRLAYSQIIAHPALDDIYSGMIFGLEEAGYKLNENLFIDYQIAQGDMALNNQIAKKFVGDKPDFIIASTTPSAQAVIAAAHGRLPIIFTGVSDPIAAKLVDNLERPGKNVTGVKEALAFQDNIDAIRLSLPHAKNIGTIYNPGEDNSNATNNRLEKLLTPLNMKLITAPAKNTGEVLDAARSLIGRVDVILITLDNTAVSGLSSIIQIAEQNKIPLFVFDTYSVPQGAAVGIGYDEFEVGKLTAEQILKAHSGQKIGDIAVEEVRTIRIVLNPKAAEKQGFTIPESLIEQASTILK